MCYSQLEYTPELCFLKKPSFLPRLTKARESWAPPARLSVPCHLSVLEYVLLLLTCGALYLVHSLWPLPPLSSACG